MKNNNDIMKSIEVYMVLGRSFIMSIGSNVMLQKFIFDFDPSPYSLQSKLIRAGVSLGLLGFSLIQGFDEIKNPEKYARLRREVAEERRRNMFIKEQAEQIERELLMNLDNNDFKRDMDNRLRDICEESLKDTMKRL